MYLQRELGITNTYTHTYVQSIFLFFFVWVLVQSGWEKKIFPPCRKNFLNPSREVDAAGGFFKNLFFYRTVEPCCGLYPHPFPPPPSRSFNGIDLDPGIFERSNGRDDYFCEERTKFWRNDPLRLFISRLL